MDLSTEAVERVAAKLAERTLIAHGGPEGIRHGWNLTPADSELHAEAAALLRALAGEREAGQFICSRCYLRHDPPRGEARF